MARLLPTSVLVGLLLLVTAWLVRGEGKLYRQGLRATRDADLWARRMGPAPAEAAPPGALAKAEPPPAGTAADTPDPPEPPAAKIPPPKPEPAIEPPAAPAKEPDRAKPEPPKVADVPAKPKRPEPAAPPPRPPDPFAGLAKDATTLTLDEERRLGEALHDLIVRRHRVLEAGDLERRMIEAARPLLSQCRRKDLDYRFIVVDSPAVNAFSHPGGYVYVSEGMFDLVADDAELQFVLGHEIAHVDLKHAAERVAASARDDPDGPGLVRRFYRQIAVGYTDDQEFAADAWSLRQLRRLGYSRRRCLSFPLRYRTFVERNALSGGHHAPKSQPESDVQDLDNHWRTLPSAAARLDRLEALRAGP